MIKVIRYFIVVWKEGVSIFRIDDGSKIQTIVSIQIVTVKGGRLAAHGSKAAENFSKSRVLDSSQTLMERGNRGHIRLRAIAADYFTVQGF